MDLKRKSIILLEYFCLGFIRIELGLRGIVLEILMERTGILISFPRMHHHHRTAARSFVSSFSSVAIIPHLPCRYSVLLEFFSRLHSGGRNTGYHPSSMNKFQLNPISFIVKVGAASIVSLFQEKPHLSSPLSFI